jgi:TonB family protein
MRNLEVGENLVAVPLFASLPAARPRWKKFLIGCVLEMAPLLCILFTSASFHRDLPQARPYRVTELLSSEPLVQREVQPVHVRVLARSKPIVEEAKPTVSPLVVTPTRVTIAKAIPPHEQSAAPDLHFASKMPTLPTAPMSAIVAVGTFSTGDVAPRDKSPAAVQTGAFGSDNKISTSERRDAGIVGETSFDVTQQSGKATTTTGTIASSGFGDSTATTGLKSAGTVQLSGFDVHYSKAESHKMSAGTDAPVEITFKPNPDYTDEARKRKINGEVRLEVLFTAQGQVHVIRVLQGLGYGLDEKAVKAAEQIKFKPASHTGQPVDSIALVQIIFELTS